MEILQTASVHCVVTSPPYFGLRDYGVAGQIGLEPSLDAYVAEMVAVFREVRRVLRPDGTLWLILGDSFANKQLMMMPARVALALQADGWWLRSDIIWAKPNPMPESITDRPTSAHEHVFLLTKSVRYFFDAEAVREASNHGGKPRTSGNKSHKHVAAYEASDSEELRTKAGLLKVADVPWLSRNMRNVWQIATSPFPGAHFATFPPKLVERCIKAGTSERGCCAACGAPWARVVERIKAVVTQAFYAGAGQHGSDGRRLLADRPGGFIGAGASTIGWQPSCACADGRPPVPCTVLDPFSGAGTTCLVADRLQRNSIGIELNPDYVTMAEARVAKDVKVKEMVSEF